MKIGPSFGSELMAAGVSPGGIMWNPDTGELFFQNVSLAVQAKVKGVLAVHDPTKLPPDQMFLGKIGAGCAVISPTRPYLNGTYQIDERMQGRVDAVATGIANGKAFPHGAASYTWPVVGGQVTFKTVADAIDVFAALRDYVADLILAEAALATGNPANWPVQPVAIA